MFDELFRRKTVDIHKAILFGFVQNNSNYIYETDILDGSFLLQIIITPDGNIDTKLTEKAIGDEYVLYKTNATGSFVGEIRKAIETILTRVADKCYNTEIFKSAQAKEIICYVREKYGDELEYLWQKFPDNAVVRRKDNQKWYAAILTVSRRKLGFDSDEMVEILDLRIKPENMESTVDNIKYFPGYHMNKKHWITVCLDGTVAMDEICRRTDESYALAKK